MNIKGNKISWQLLPYYPLSLLTCMTNGNIILCRKDVKHRISSYEIIHKHICVSRACCILRDLRFNYKKK